MDTTIREDDREISFFCTKYSDCAGRTVHRNSDGHRGDGADISEEVKAVGHTNVGSAICQAALVINLAHMWTGGITHEIVFQKWEATDTWCTLEMNEAFEGILHFRVVFVMIIYPSDFAGMS